MLPSEVLRRLKALKRRHPRQDKAAVEAALTRHFDILGAPRHRQIRWYATTREAWSGIRTSFEDGQREWVDFEGRVVSCNWLDLFELDLPWLRRTQEGNDPLSKAQRASWTGQERAMMRDHGVSYFHACEDRHAPFRSSAFSAAWLARPEALEPRDRRALLALLEAAEAGLWVFWPRRDETAVVMRPSIWAQHGRLHRLDGPALSFFDGPSYHYWRGVLIPDAVAERWESIRAVDILRDTNVEARRVMLERFGFPRFLEESGAQPIHSDRWGRLYRIDLDDDEPLILVNVVNATPEPDGTRREYFLRAPPGVQTAREAVAWTFGMDGGEYAPALET